MERINMNKENNEKLEQFKKALNQINNEGEAVEETEVEEVLRENKRTILKGNFRKDLQTEQ